MTEIIADNFPSEDYVFNENPIIPQTPWHLPTVYTPNRPAYHRQFGIDLYEVELRIQRFVDYANTRDWDNLDPNYEGEFANIILNPDYADVLDEEFDDEFLLTVGVITEDEYNARLEAENELLNETNDGFDMTEHLYTVGYFTLEQYMERREDEKAAKSNSITEYELTEAEVANEWECAICIEKGSEAAAWHPNNCHIFHRACLNLSLAKNPRCPLCRGHGKLVRNHKTL